MVSNQPYHSPFTRVTAGDSQRGAPYWVEKLRVPTRKIAPASAIRSTMLPDFKSKAFSNLKLSEPGTPRCLSCRDCHRDRRIADTVSPPSAVQSACFHPKGSGCSQPDIEYPNPYPPPPPSSPAERNKQHGADQSTNRG